MATGDSSFDEILNGKPTLTELCKDVPISTNWKMMGTLLELDVRKLNEIEHESKSVCNGVLKMYELWLNTKPQATRRQIVDTLKMEAVGQMSLAIEYEEKLRQLSVPINISEVHDEAVAILQDYYTALSQSLIYPVDVSQLLYSKKCISERTLDEIETLESSADNKKTILLTAIHIAVSLDHLMLKIFATVLSKFDEMRILGNKILIAYVQKFPNNEGEPVLQEVVVPGHQISLEDSASDILRYHYGTLSRHLRYPINVAQLLCEEKVISDITLSHVQDSERSQSERKTVLLKSLRHAVHINHHNLEVFASVLKRFTENVPLGNAIFNDYLKTVMKDKVQFVVEDTNISDVTTTINSSTQQDTTVNSSTQQKCCKIPVPQSMSSQFTSIRTKFGSTFNIIRRIIKSNPPPLEDMKEFLEDCDSSLKPSLAHCENISAVLNVVRDKCTLIDINYLEEMVTTFNIEGAKTHIESYKKMIEEFCQSVSVRLCLEELFPVTATPPSIRFETATFVLDWDPDDYTLNDIRTLLSVVFERLAKRVTVKVIKEGNSINVTCTFPLNLLGPLIAKAQKTIMSMNKKGLITLTIGHCIVWDVRKRDEKIRCLEKEQREALAKKDQEIMKLKSSLEVYTNMEREGPQDQSSTDTLSEKMKLLDRMSKAKTLEIEKLTRYKETTDKVLVENQKEIEVLQEKTTSLTLQLMEREEKISQLLKKMKDLKSQIAEVSVWIKSVNPELSQQLDEIVTDKKNIPTSTSQDTTSTRQEIKTQLSEDKISTIVTSDTQESSSISESTSDQIKTEQVQVTTSETERDTGSVKWESDRVILTSSTVAECKEVIHQLKRRQHTTWYIELYTLSPQSLLTVLTDINECQVKELYIVNTHFDINCVSQLSQVITYNKTMEELYLDSSPLLPNTYHLLTTAVTGNKIIKVLQLYNDTNITDKDIPHLSNLIINNNTLQRLYLIDCPKINKFGEQQLQNVVVKNNSLKSLYVNDNYLR